MLDLSKTTVDVVKKQLLNLLHLKISAINGFIQRHHIFSHPANEKHEEGLIEAFGGYYPKQKT